MEINSDDVKEDRYVKLTIQRSKGNRKNNAKRQQRNGLSNINNAKKIYREIQKYETIIRPVLMYASETWTLNKQDETVS